MTRNVKCLGALAAALAVGGAASFGHAQSGQTAAALQESSFRAKVDALGLAQLPPAVPAWHVKGAGPRAEYLQRLLGEQRAYYREVFGVDVPIGVAVLDPEHWSKVAPKVPYGLPFVSAEPYTAAMPASWDEVRWLPFPNKAQGSPALVLEADRLGLDWDAALRSGADLIVTHEFGHTLVHKLGLDPRSFWLGELLATYAGYAFIMERRPKLAAPNRLFNLSVANGPHPQTSLKYLDENYRTLATKNPANYGWYQGRIFERAEVVYRQEGLGFFAKVRTAFAARNPKTHEEVLDTLESISPGWKAWAAGMAAGT